MENVTSNSVIVAGKSYEPEELERIKETMARIHKEIKKIEGGYLAITGDVAYLYDSQAWHGTGHKNIYDLCADKFGMSRATVHNLLTIYRHYGDGNYHLNESIKDKKITTLLKEIKDLSKLAAEVQREELGLTSSSGGSAGSNSEPEKTQERRKQLLKVEITTETPDWTKEELAQELVKRMGDLAIGSDFTFQLIITG